MAATVANGFRVVQGDVASFVEGHDEDVLLGGVLGLLGTGSIRHASMYVSMMALEEESSMTNRGGPLRVLPVVRVTQKSYHDAASVSHHDLRCASQPRSLMKDLDAWKDIMRRRFTDRFQSVADKVAVLSERFVGKNGDVAGRGVDGGDGGAVVHGVAQDNCDAVRACGRADDRVMRQIRLEPGDVVNHVAWLISPSSSSSSSSSASSSSSSASSSSSSSSSASSSFYSLPSSSPSADIFANGRLPVKVREWDFAAYQTFLVKLRPGDSVRVEFAGLLVKDKGGAIVRHADAIIGKDGASLVFRGAPMRFSAYGARSQAVVSSTLPVTDIRRPWMDGLALHDAASREAAGISKAAMLRDTIVVVRLDVPHAAWWPSVADVAVLSGHLRRSLRSIQDARELAMMDRCFRGLSPQDHAHLKALVEEQGDVNDDGATAQSKGEKSDGGVKGAIVRVTGDDTHLDVADDGGRWRFRELMNFWSEVVVGQSPPPRSPKKQPKLSKGGGDVKGGGEVAKEAQCNRERLAALHTDGWQRLLNGGFRSATAPFDRAFVERWAAIPHGNPKKEGRSRVDVDTAYAHAKYDGALLPSLACVKQGFLEMADLVMKHDKADNGMAYSHVRTFEASCFARRRSRHEEVLEEERRGDTRDTTTPAREEQRIVAWWKSPFDRQRPFGGRQRHREHDTGSRSSGDRIRRRIEDDGGEDGDGDERTLRIGIQDASFYRPMERTRRMADASLYKPANTSTAPAYILQMFDNALAGRGCIDKGLGSALSDVILKHLDAHLPDAQAKLQKQIQLVKQSRERLNLEAKRRGAKISAEDLERNLIARLRVRHVRTVAAVIAVLARSCLTRARAGKGESTMICDFEEAVDTVVGVFDSSPSKKETREEFRRAEALLKRWTCPTPASSPSIHPNPDPNPALRRPMFACRTRTILRLKRLTEDARSKRTCCLHPTTSSHSSSSRTSSMSSAAKDAAVLFKAAGAPLPSPIPRHAPPTVVVDEKSYAMTIDVPRPILIDPLVLPSSPSPSPSSSPSSLPPVFRWEAVTSAKEWSAARELLPAPPLDWPRLRAAFEETFTRVVRRYATSANAELLLGYFFHEDAHLNTREAYVTMTSFLRSEVATTLIRIASETDAKTDPMVAELVRKAANGVRGIDKGMLLRLAQQAGSFGQYGTIEAAKDALTALAGHMAAVAMERAVSAAKLPASVVGLLLKRLCDSVLFNRENAREEEIQLMREEREAIKRRKLAVMEKLTDEDKEFLKQYKKVVGAAMDWEMLDRYYGDRPPPEPRAIDVVEDDEDARFRPEDARDLYWADGDMEDAAAAQTEIDVDNGDVLDDAQVGDI